MLESNRSKERCHLVNRAFNPVASGNSVVPVNDGDLAQCVTKSRCILLNLPSQW